MQRYNSSLLNALHSRGLIGKLSDPIPELDSLLTGKCTIYLGIDPTGDLHYGHLMPLTVMILAYKFSHQVILLLGGATSRVGDPTGRDTTRSVMNEHEVSNNINRIKCILEKLFKVHDPMYQYPIMIVDNSSWLNDIKFLDFLFTVGSSVSVNKMLSMDIIKNRIENNHHLSYLEFNYPLIQGYDFKYLNEKYNCTIQVGGQDQWCNILSGIDMAKRMNNKSLFAITTPLLTDSEGKKIGKSSGNSPISLNASPYDIWQYFRNINDSYVRDLLYKITLNDIDNIEAVISSDINEAKKLLATSIVSMLHGKECIGPIEDIAIMMNSNHFSLDKINPEYFTNIYINKTDNIISYRDILLRSEFELFSIRKIKEVISSNSVRVNGNLLKSLDDNPYMSNIDGFICISVGKKIVVCHLER